MTKTELDNYITLNYKEINTIINIHIINQYKTKNKLSTDVVFSNLYMHLLKKIDDLTNENIKGYIVQYCYKLKYWYKNRHINLTEKNEKENTILNDSDINFLDPNVNENLLVEQDINYNKVINDIVTDFINYSDKNHIEKKLLLDSIYNKIETYSDVKVFYNMKNTYASKTIKEIKILREEFLNYCYENIN